MTLSAALPVDFFRQEQIVATSPYIPQLLIGIFALFWLYPALRPKSFTEHMLAQYARDHIRLPNHYQMLSRFSWGVFAFLLCVALSWTIIHALQVPVNQRLFEAVIFLVFAGCYVWWGYLLLRKPQQFRERWPRMPEWAVKSFGVVLLLVAVLWTYLFLRL